MPWQPCNPVVHSVRCGLVSHAWWTHALWWCIQTALAMHIAIHKVVYNKTWQAGGPDYSKGIFPAGSCCLLCVLYFNADGAVARRSALSCRDGLHGAGHPHVGRSRLGVGDCVQQPHLAFLQGGTWRSHLTTFVCVCSCSGELAQGMCFPQRSVFCLFLCIFFSPFALLTCARVSPCHSTRSPRLATTTTLPTAPTRSTPTKRTTLPRASAAVARPTMRTLTRTSPRRVGVVLWHSMHCLTCRVVAATRHITPSTSTLKQASRRRWLSFPPHR